MKITRKLHTVHNSLVNEDFDIVAIDISVTKSEYKALKNSFIKNPNVVILSDGYDDYPTVFVHSSSKSSLSEKMYKFNVDGE